MGQSRPFPAAGLGGRTIQRSGFPRREAARSQMCRHIAAAPSPFREGHDGPCPFPFGPSHPSQKATMPRPLHLGPICCCWLPSLPPALNSDVFNHTHQRRRAAPREPQLAAHFLLVAAKRGAASWGTAGASLPRESDRGGSGCSGPGFTLQWHFGGSCGHLCPQTSTGSESSCQQHLCGDRDQATSSPNTV